MSAGLIGSAGLGYAKDRFAAEDLKAKNPAAYEKYVGKKPSTFLMLEPILALDGAKLSEAQKAASPTPEQKEVAASSIAGDRKTLVADSAIPATMALIYLVLVLYFKTIGGYKAVHIGEGETSAEKKEQPAEVAA